MLEFAVVFPIFLLLVITFVDAARYVVARGVVSTALENALSRAATIPNLDLSVSASDSPARQAEVQQAIQRARESVLETAGQAGMSGVLSPVRGQGIAWIDSITLVLPTPAANESMEEAMRTKPISVVITAKMKTFSPLLPELSIERKVTGFREARKVASLPIPVDCNGNRITSGNFFAAACPCVSPRMAWNAGQMKCVCVAGLIPTADGNDCRCADNRMDYQWGTCVCRAPFLSVFGGCQCPAPRVQVNGSDGLPTCACLQSSCSSGLEFDPVGCGCVCASGPTVQDFWNPMNATCGTCNENQNWNPVLKSCVCKVEPTNCSYGWNNSSCECNEPYDGGDSDDEDLAPTPDATGSPSSTPTGSATPDESDDSDDEPGGNPTPDPDPEPDPDPSPTAEPEPSRPAGGGVRQE